VQPLSEIHASVGRKVRQLREERRWSQAELAEKLELSQTRLSDIERGRASFSVALNPCSAANDTALLPDDRHCSMASRACSIRQRAPRRFLSGSDLLMGASDPELSARAHATLDVVRGGVTVIR
jgi:DNA-binding XRE family transcriptional regulator